MNINTSPYPVSLEIVNNWDAFRTKYKKYKGKEPDECSLGTTTYYGEYGNKVLIGIFDSNYITLIYELNHFCIFTMEYIGMDITTRSSEAYCYYMDSILKQIPSSYLTA